MSQLPPPPPYGGQPDHGSAQPPYAPYAPYAPAPPRRRRPRPVWWVIGGTLLVLAPIIFVVALITVLRPLTQEDAVFAVGDSPVQLDLAAGEERALFTSGAPADCSAVRGNGEAVELRPVNGEFTFNEWTAVSRFDTGDGDVTFTCQALDAGSEVRIAQLPSTGGLVAGIVIGVLGPVVLGGIGLVVLIVTAVRHVTGAPRQDSDSRPGPTHAS